MTTLILGPALWSESGYGLRVAVWFVGVCS